MACVYKGILSVSSWCSALEFGVYKGQDCLSLMYKRRLAPRRAALPSGCIALTPLGVNRTGAFQLGLKEIKDQHVIQGRWAAA